MYVGRWHVDLEIMASIETVVQNAEGEMGDDTKPDSTAEVKEEPGEIWNFLYILNFFLTKINCAQVIIQNKFRYILYI